jgi:hypothetical protein
MLIDRRSAVESAFGFLRRAKSRMAGSSPRWFGILPRSSGGHLSGPAHVRCKSPLESAASPIARAYPPAGSGPGPRWRLSPSRLNAASYRSVAAALTYAGGKWEDRKRQERQCRLVNYSLRERAAAQRLWRHHGDNISLSAKNSASKPRALRRYQQIIRGSFSPGTRRSSPSRSRTNKLRRSLV